jgi:EmrB/QacA subfamily drug resistance transporter
MTSEAPSFTSKLKSSSHYRWYILANVSIGTFMSTLDASIVNVALPTISADLHSELSVLQWVVTAYLLVISSLLPVFGRIADLVGRKRIYSIGFLVFTLGSLLCGLAQNIWFLVAMRIVQAIGAAMLMSNSAAIITATFPPQERGRALGLTGTVVALGSLSGPAIGGLLLGMTSWRFIFYLNLPIGIIGYFAAQVILPPDHPRKNKETFDTLGAVFFSIGMIFVLFALSNGQDWGWSSAPILIGLILGTTLLISFFITETRVSHPMIDLSLFKNRPFFIGNLSGFLSFVAMFSNMMLMPFYLQHILNFQPLQVGLIMTANPLIMAIVAPISGRASDRLGPVALTTTGLAITSLGLFYLTTVSSVSTAWYVIPGPLLMGLGAGLFQSPNNSSVMSSVPKAKLGVAGGINALVRNVGMVVGTALAVTLFDNRQAAVLSGIQNPDITLQTSAFLSAYHTVLYTGAVIALLAVFISLNRKGYARAEAPSQK